MAANKDGRLGSYNKLIPDQMTFKMDKDMGDRENLELAMHIDKLCKQDKEQASDYVDSKESNSEKSGWIEKPIIQFGQLMSATKETQSAKDQSEDREDGDLELPRKQSTVSFNKRDSGLVKTASNLDGVGGSDTPAFLGRSEESKNFTVEQQQTVNIAISNLQN